MAVPARCEIGGVRESNYQALTEVTLPGLQAFADPLSWDARGRVSAKTDTRHPGPREDDFHRLNNCQGDRTRMHMLTGVTLTE